LTGADALRIAMAFRFTAQVEAGRAFALRKI
jgi:hypothetical protein